jgi:hypothetical protein
LVLFKSHNSHLPTTSGREGLPRRERESEKWLLSNWDT